MTDAPSPSRTVFRQAFERLSSSSLVNRAVMLAVLSFNFIGDGLRDAIDPKDC